MAAQRQRIVVVSATTMQAPLSPADETEGSELPDLDLLLDASESSLFEEKQEEKTSHNEEEKPSLLAAIPEPPADYRTPPRLRTPKSSPTGDPPHFSTPVRHLGDFDDADVTWAQSEDVLKRSLRSDKPSAASSPRHGLTVAQGPKLSTSERHPPQPLADPDPSMASSEDFYRKALRDGKYQSSSPATTPRRLTVPQPPKLHEHKSPRPHDPDPSMASSEDVLRKTLRNGKPYESKKVHRTVTVPEGPKLHESHKQSTVSDDEFVPMASSGDLLRKGLRSGYEQVNKQVSHLSITIPEEPHFHELHHRPKPKSSEELALEEMERHRKMQFKAMPLPAQPIEQKLTPTKARGLTVPQPFHFLSEERAAAHTHEISVKDPEAEDLLELQHQFHARPMPDFSHAGELSSPTRVRGPTQPQPFHLSQTNRRKVSSPPTSVEDEVVEASFRARPVPKSTYAPTMQPRQAPSPRKASSSPRTPNSSPKSIKCQERHEKADAMQRAKEATRRSKQEAKQQGTIQHGSPKKATPTSTPFHLRSAARHEEAVRKRAEAIQKEEEEQRRLATFKARPMPKKNGECTDEWWRVFLFACLFRLANTFLIQSYFDPDEFWQTMEPAYCQVFDAATQWDCPGYTWEWKRRSESEGWVEQALEGPARTYLSVLPTILLYKVLKFMAWDNRWMVARAPMLLAAVTVGAPIDTAVWYTAKWLSPNHQWWALFGSLSSWFAAFTYVRTLANGQETLFLILAIALVGPELLGNYTNARRSILRACIAFFLGGLSTTIRGTAVTAFVPMGLLLALRFKSFKARIAFLFGVCAIFGLLGIGVAMLVDRYYFGFWAVPFLGNFHFNVILNRAGLYGTHPKHWYFSSGMPAVAGSLLPFLWYDLWKLVSGRVSYGGRNLWFVSLLYMVSMSGNAHKEFRYILPLLPVFAMLSASHTSALIGRGGRVWRRALIGLVVALNLLAILYLGLFHQSGPVSVNREIVRRVYRSENAASPTPQEVHYLTGECHSTPLLSHLHLKPHEFQVWHLDCSPSCRANPTVVCETLRFQEKPARFVQKEYLPCLGSEEDGYCNAASGQRRIPNYVVTFSTYVPNIGPTLEGLGLREVARFPQNINGARIGEVVLGEDYRDDRYSRYSIGFLGDISVEEVVLFELVV